MYIDESLKKYLDEVSARKSTPGGGSVAGVCGAMGTALLEMVCNFTIGNEKYKGVEPDIQMYLRALSTVREEFSVLIDEDVKVYSEIRSVFKTKDKKNIDKALKSGYYVSLKICELSKNGIELAKDLSRKGNINLITDVGCGAECLRASFNSGVFNCEVNLKGMEDRDFIDKEKAVLDELKYEIELLYKDTIGKVVVSNKV